MKIVYNKIIPFKGFIDVILFGILFIREEFKNRISAKIIRHATIHSVQMKEMGYIFFYLWYGVEWLFRIFTPPFNTAYKDISFEQEAYMHEDDIDYLKHRKPYHWITRIFKSYRKECNYGK